MFSLMRTILLVFALLQSQVVYAATAEQWRTRSIYQVFTDRFARVESSTSKACPPGYQGYCGGSWRGIIEKLDYIQGMGFTAIWISPIVAQVADETRAYNGYSASNLYSLNSNFGTASDLVALSKALHDRGMFLMVDVVVNHMGWDGMSDKIDYNSFNPFNDKKFFHNTCWINNYDNQTEIEKCWLGTANHPLPDIDTGRSDVRQMFSSWIQSMVSLYSIDGLRVDTVKHVEKEFWPGFITASGVFNLGEVANGDVDYVCPYQKHITGLLDYPSFYQSTLFFSNTSFPSEDFVKEFEHLGNNCVDTTILGSFSENHDQPRFASLNPDITLARNIMTYTFQSGGIPIVYQGQEAHFASAMDPFNREALWQPNNTLSPVAYSTPYSKTSPLYTLITKLNLLRKVSFNQFRDFTTSQTSIVYSDANNIMFRKGSGSLLTLTVVNNLGSKTSKRTLTLDDSGFASGMKLVDVISCKEVTVDKKGGLKLEVSDGEPLVYIPQKLRHDVNCNRASSTRLDMSATLKFQMALLLLAFVLFY